MRTTTMDAKMLGGMLMIGSMAAMVSAGTVTWTGGGANNYWTTAANWDTGVPSATDDVKIGSSFTSGNTIDVGGLVTPTTVNSLTLQNLSAADITIGSGGQLQLTSGGLTRGASDAKSIYLKVAKLYLPSGNSAWNLGSKPLYLEANAIETIGGSGTSTIVKTGAGTITLNKTGMTYAGNWDYTGSISSNMGNSLGQGSFTWRSTATTVWTYTYTANQTFSNNIILTNTGGYFLSNTVTNGVVTYSGDIGGTLGSNTLYFNFDGGNVNNSATVVLSGTNSMTGTSNQFYVAAGTLRLDHTGQLNAVGIVGLGRNGTGTGNLVFNVAETVNSKFYNRNSLGAVDQITMNTTGTTTLTGQYSLNNGTTTDGANVKLSAIAGGTLALTGMMTDQKNLSGTAITSPTARSVTKIGDGTVILSGANEYQGGTIVSAGTLLVNNTTGSGTGTGAVSIASAATLGGTGSISGSVTLVDNAILAPGASAGTLTVGQLTLGNATALNFELNGSSLTVGGGVNDLVQVNGNLMLDGIVNLSVFNGTLLQTGTYRLMNYTGTLTDNGLVQGTGFASNYSLSVDTANKQVNLIVAPIPEPASLGLMMLGSLFILARRK